MLQQSFPEKAWLFLPSAFLAVFLFLYIGIGINVFLFLSFCPCRLMRELQCWWGNWGGEKRIPEGDYWKCVKLRQQHFVSIRQDCFWPFSVGLRKNRTTIKGNERVLFGHDNKLFAAWRTFARQKTFRCELWILQQSETFNLIYYTNPRSINQINSLRVICYSNL